MPRPNTLPKVVRVDVCGTPFLIEEGEPILTGLARCVGEPVAAGNYCWSGECGHCEVAYEASDGKTRTGMSCLLSAGEGLRVTRLSRYLEIDLRR